MNIYASLNKLQLSKKNCVALGFFDGVHLGHRSVIQAAVKRAEENKIQSSVFTFSLNGAFDIKQNEILDEQQKQERIASLNVENYICPPFSEFCKLTPREFVYDILSSRLQAKEVFCGGNFTFGANKSGDTAALINLCSQKNIGVSIIEMELYKNEPVSSTRIREALKNGNMQAANEMLAKPYCVLAKVIKGQGLGHKLSVPTINQVFEQNMLMPRGGVYASRINLDGKAYAGATGIGNRPTVSGTGITCETYIKGFEGNLYGANIKVELIKYLAPTQKFASLNELRSCILSAAEESAKLL